MHIVFFVSFEMICRSPPR